MERIVEYIRSHYGDALEKELAFLKLEAKFPFLISGDSKKFQLWNEWYPEANAYILQNNNISARSRWVQWLASKGQYGLVKIYFVLLMKVVYGIIYR